MKSTILAGSATLVAAGAFASPAMAATVDFTASSVGSGTEINLVGDPTAEYYFSSANVNTLRGKEFSGNTVGPVSATPYFPDGSSTSQMKTQTTTTDGYYGLFFHDNVDLTAPIGTNSGNAYTGFALVDRGGTHISQIDFQVAPSAVPEPASWALMLLGFGAAGAALRQRRRNVPAAAAA